MIKHIFPLLALVNFYCYVVASYFIFRWFNDRKQQLKNWGDLLQAGSTRHPPRWSLQPVTSFSLRPLWIPLEAPLCWVPGSSSNAPPTKALHTHFLLVRQQHWNGKCGLCYSCPQGWQPNLGTEESEKAVSVRPGVECILRLPSVTELTLQCYG